MDPHDKWCHNARCRAYGLPGEGHVVIHSREKERRYQCKRCRRTFTERKDTALYRAHKPEWLVVAVVTLLSYGCPLQAIVVAFDLDERTVARWQRESGAQCRRVHGHLLEAGKVALLQVCRLTRSAYQGGRCGLLVGLCAGGEEPAVVGWGLISLHRDRELIRSLLELIRECAPVEHILVVTDGLASYKSQALKVFRRPLRSGKVGRPRLVLAEGVMVGRVIKRYQRKRVVEVVREVVCGAKAEVISRVIGPQRSLRALINTAYIERLQATFRGRLAPLARRTRAGVHRRCRLEAGMWLVGGCYNLVRVHRSLGEGRTPAMAAGLTDHRWTMEELLSFAVPPAELPRWRGRKPKWLIEAERAA